MADVEFEGPSDNLIALIDHRGIDEVGAAIRCHAGTRMDVAEAMQFQIQLIDPIA